jgi:hypothetical protein
MTTYAYTGMLRIRMHIITHAHIHPLGDACVNEYTTHSIHRCDRHLEVILGLVDHGDHALVRDLGLIAPGEDTMIEHWYVCMYVYDLSFMFVCMYDAVLHVYSHVM